jgi:hypothetical protein
VISTVDPVCAITAGAANAELRLLAVVTAAAAAVPATLFSNVRRLTIVPSLLRDHDKVRAPHRHPLPESRTSDTK